MLTRKFKFALKMYMRVFFNTQKDKKKTVFDFSTIYLMIETLFTHTPLTRENNGQYDR